MKDSQRWKQQLRVLLWKESVLKRRRPISTVVEVFAPLVLFGVLIVLRQAFIKEDMPPESFAPLALPNSGGPRLVQSIMCNGIPSIDPDQGPYNPQGTPLENIWSTFSGLSNVSEQDVLNVASIMAPNAGDDFAIETATVFGLLQNVVAEYKSGNQDALRHLIESGCPSVSSLLVTLDDYPLDRTRNTSSRNSSSIPGFNTFSEAQNVTCETGGTEGTVYTENYDYVNKSTVVNFSLAGTNLESMTICGSFCQNTSNCTGFSVKTDEPKRCIIWRFGSCSGKRTSGYISQPNIVTFYQTDLGSPAGKPSALRIILDMVQSVNLTTIPDPSTRSVIHMLQSAAFSLLEIPELAPFLVTGGGGGGNSGLEQVQGVVCGKSNSDGNTDTVKGSDAMDLAASPLHGRLSQFLELFSGVQLIQYAPVIDDVKTVVTLANRTFDELATLFSVYQCLQTSQARHIAANEHGLVIQRWYNVITQHTPDATDPALIEFYSNPDPQYTAIHSKGVYSAPVDIGEHFASRILGVLQPQMTGIHKIGVACDDVGSLIIAEEGVEVIVKDDALVWVDCQRRKSDTDKDLRYDVSILLNASKRYQFNGIYVESTRNDGFVTGLIDPTGFEYYPIPIDPFLYFPVKFVGKSLPVDSQMVSFVRSFDIFKSPDEIASRKSARNVSYARDDSLLAAIEFQGISEDRILPIDHRYHYKLRQSRYKTPSTRDRRVRVGRYWGSTTWFRYYFAGFALVQDMVDRALINFSASSNASSAEYASQTLMVQKMPVPFYQADTFSLVLTAVAPLTMVLAWIFPFSMLIKEIVLEREAQLKQSLLLMGLKPTVYWFAKAATALTFFTISAILVSIMIVSGGIFPASNPFIVFLFVEGFALSTVSIAFVISTIFTQARVAAACGSLIFVALYLPFFYVASDAGQHLTPASMFGMCMLSPTAFALGTSYFASFEQQGVGAQWGNLSEGVGVCADFSIAAILFALYFDALFYACLAYYSECVLPVGQTAKRHPLFLFSKSFWQQIFPNRPADRNLSVSSGDATTNVENEDVSGILIRRITKEFNGGIFQRNSKVVALNDLSLNMKSGEITGLLGHNGAGKSTLISILTGMIQPSSGNATVDGLSVIDKSDQIRRRLGVCHQHELLFDLMSVDEHLWLVGRLRGLDTISIQQQCENLLSDLHFKSSRGKVAGALSGGMKRKLSLMLAYIGDPQLVILDEPTAGMDPSTRRQAWDLILSRRQDRTVVLTTHHMDEADLLSDTLCILADGRLCCQGRSLELKSRFGGNYLCQIQLKHTLAEESKKAITDIFTSFIPDANLKEEAEATLSIALPAHDRTKFPALFNALETQSSKLEILNISLQVCSLETIFLNVLKENDSKSKMNRSNTSDGDDDELIDLEKTEIAANIEVTSHVDFLVGWPLVKARAKALIFKRWHNAKRDYRAILGQTLLPVSFIWLTMYCLGRFGPDAPEPTLVLNTNVYSGCPEENTVPVHRIHTDAMVGLPKNNYVNLTKNQEFLYPGTNGLPEWCGGVCFFPDNVTSFLLRTGGADDDRHGAMTRPESNASNQILSAWFNSLDSHSLPIYLSLANNLLLKKVAGENAEIKVTNDPLPGSSSMSLYYRFIMPIDETAVILILISLTFIPASFALFLVQERKQNVKHLQVACGVSPLEFWGFNFAWDMSNYIAVAIVIIFVFSLVGTAAYTGTNLPMMAALIVLYGWAVIPMIYLSTFYFREPSTAYVALVLGNMAIGIVCILTVFELRFLATRKKEYWVDLYNFADRLFMIFPTYSVGSGMLSIANNFYDYQLDVELAEARGDDLPDFISPAAWEIGGRSVVVLFIEGIATFAFTILVEYRLRRQTPSSTNLSYPAVSIDDDVREEQRRISTTSVEDTLKVTGLSKEYSSSKSCTSRSREHSSNRAVSNLSFGVKKGSCFGLLGVNGAGKTTTFRMLTGDLAMTCGDVKIGGCSVRTDLCAAQKQCGYCPQYDGILPRLTGRELLYMFGRLRGIPDDVLEKQVVRSLDLMQLHKHADKCSGGYSGGNRRKLSVAIAMLSDPPVMFLDEPTAGMDLLARRFLWSRIQAAINCGCAVVLTSHSMDECRFLCDRLAIMVDGQFRCLGSPQHLVKKFGHGYTIVINCSKGHVDEALSSLRNLFGDFTLKEQHAEHIQLSITYASMPSLANTFSALDGLRLDGVLEDYEVGETSLDEIFCDFAEKSFNWKSQDASTSKRLGEIELKTLSSPTRSFHTTTTNRACELSDDDNDNDLQLLLP